jgi:predicted dehydrogenase
MTKKLKWGIIGTGAIARKFAQGLAESQTGALTAVGSRTLESAQKFAAEFFSPATAHGSYEALLADPEVEAVYISTPHPQHAEWAVKAADAGRHVLCEKPLALNHAEATGIVDAARRNNVFLMEAFMYRCHPQTLKLVELIREKVIGDVQMVQATFSFRADFDPMSRLFNRALGGGGILDVGCYCVSGARLIAGAAAGKPFEEPVVFVGTGCVGAESRVDEYAVASLKFPGGIVAQLAAGTRLNLENTIHIRGTGGSLIVPSPWVVTRGARFSKIIIFKNNTPQEVLVEVDRGIYAIEADHVAEHLHLKQSPAMSWADSLGNMRALDQWRSAVGVVYDSEKADAPPQ